MTLQSLSTVNLLIKCRRPASKLYYYAFAQRYMCRTYYVLLLSFLSFFSFFSTRNLGDPLADCPVCHMTVNECNLRNWVRNLGALALKICGPKHENLDPVLDNFPTSRRITLEVDILPTHLSSVAHLP